MEKITKFNKRVGWNKRVGGKKSINLINILDGINLQAGKILKINKRAGWNFSFFISKNRGFGLKFPKIDKRAGHAGWNLLKKLIRFAAQLLVRLE